MNTTDDAHRPPPGGPGGGAAAVQPHGFVARVAWPGWCARCGLDVAAHRSWPATAAAAAAHLHAELTALRAELKDCQRDTEGLMYERRDGQLVLRKAVGTADTNGEATEADTRIQAARGHVADLLDFMEYTRLAAPPDHHAPDPAVSRGHPDPPQGEETNATTDT